jgi:hypothetical protein
MSAIELETQYQQHTVVKEIYRNFLLCITQFDRGYRGSLHKGSQHYFDAIGTNLDNLVQQLRNHVDKNLLCRTKTNSKHSQIQIHLHTAMQTVFPNLTLEQQSLLLAHLDLRSKQKGRERSFNYLLRNTSIHSYADILIAFALIANRISDELGLTQETLNGKLNPGLNLILNRRIDEKGREHFKLHRGIVDAIAKTPVSR